MANSLKFIAKLTNGQRIEYDGSFPYSIQIYGACRDMFQEFTNIQTKGDRHGTYNLSDQFGLNFGPVGKKLKNHILITEQYLLRELAKLAPKFSTLPFEKFYRLENGQTVEGYTTHGDYRDNSNWDFYDPINFGDFITNFEGKYSRDEDEEDEFEALKFDNCTQTNFPELFKLIDGCFTGDTLLGRPTSQYELIEYWID